MMQICAMALFKIIFVAHAVMNIYWVDLKEGESDS
jgi:hypothetical protein